MAVTVTDKGNYVEIDRGEVSRRYVVKPFDVDICGTDTISLGDGLKNNWDFKIVDLTGWTYSDIYDLKDQLIALNNSYSVNATITAQIGEVEISNDVGNPVPVNQILVANVTVNNLPASVTAITLQAQNSLRRELVIHNNSNGTLYVLCGTGVTPTNYSYKVDRQDTCIIDTYRGSVSGVGTSSTGFYMVTEKYN